MDDETVDDDTGGRGAFGAQLAQADPGLFLGLAYPFGEKGGAGITLKVVSSRKEDTWVGAAGVTYYPWAASDPVGFDVGVGYVFDHAAVTVGWDFLHSPQIGAGPLNTKKKSVAPSAVPGVAPGGGGGT